MKILNQTEALELLLGEKPLVDVAEEYVLIERPKTGKVTLEGDIVRVGGEYYSKISYIRRVDMKESAQELEDALVRHLEHMNVGDAIAKADAEAQDEWVHKRRGELFEEMGYTQDEDTPPLITKMLDRLAAAEFKMKMLEADNV